MRAGLGSGSQSGGGESFGELSEHHCHLIEPASLSAAASGDDTRTVPRGVLKR